MLLSVRWRWWDRSNWRWDGSRVEGAVIGADVRIGRNCDVGANSSLQFALIGDDVLIHPCCSIGQDGFGYTFAAGRALKIPQTARVLKFRITLKLVFERASIAAACAIR